MVGGVDLPGVNVHPIVSNHHVNIHRSLRRRAVGVTGTATTLLARGLHRTYKTTIRYIVSSAYVTNVTRTTTYRRGFDDRGMNLAVAMAPY